MFTAYFGTKQSPALPAESSTPLEQASLRMLCQGIPLSTHIQAIAVLDQIHGSIVHYINDLSDEIIKSPRTVAGDALITQRSDIALAVLTADCIPLFLYEPDREIMIAIHGGWKGLAGGIVDAVRCKVDDIFAIDLTTMQAFIGPAAQACCYEITPPFLDHIPPHYHAKTVMRRNNKYYFDLTQFSQLLLQDAGVPLSSMNLNQKLCTVCSCNHWSYRREQKAAQRALNLGLIEKRKISTVQ